ncbi:MAG: hypothetical protein H7Z43_11905 [Clostridia bacterium]|nr:hypothetical protein [Deltaproteobacteria bacterium]
MSNLNGGDGKRNSAISRNTDDAQGRTPSMERLDEAMTAHGNTVKRSKDDDTDKKDDVPPENDRESRVAEGNYNASDGYHTEEVPRTKGKSGNRVSTTDGSWSSTSKSKTGNR